LEVRASGTGLLPFAFCRLTLKVVHAAKFYPPYVGGMETFLQYLCDGTAGEWDVRVVAANTSATTVHERVGQVRVTRAAALGVVASVSMCPTLPLHLWS